MNKALFLDRDGTLIEEVNFLHSPEQVRWIEGVPEALARLCAQGWLPVMVTNQSGVARGLFTMEDVQSVYDYMQNSLKPYGAELAAMYCCPHHPDFSSAPEERNCSCRKPGHGMYLQAARDFSLDLSRCAAFGDRLTDVQAPLELGCRSFLVRTGYGKTNEQTARNDKSGRFSRLEFCDTLADGLRLLEKQA